jgi:hypothetical protein
MSWECVQRTLCKCGHKVWASKQMDFAQLAHSLRQPSNNLPGGDPFGDWRKIVEEYSNRYLSNGGDKLIALSALARLIYEGFRNSKGEPLTYVAGLWKEDFLGDLTWRTISA